MYAALLRARPIPSVRLHIPERDRSDASTHANNAQTNFHY